MALSRLVLLIALASAVAATPITTVVAYGDSYSDNGNLGHESNGPVIVEQLASLLGVPLIDHAYVGATTGVGNLSDFGNLDMLGNRGYPGMSTSVNKDLANPPANPASTLYVVWGGHNDILINGQIQGVTNILRIVSSLQAAGATHILVPGVMDLGLTPFGNRPAVSAQFTAISRTFNSQLQAQLPSGVTYIDTAAILEMIVAHPGDYGLNNVTAGCSLVPGCSNPDQYLFWDSFHPTTQVNNIFARDFADTVIAVPEPSSGFLLVAAGCVTVLALRKLRCAM